MSRPLRLEYPHAWYHVMNRGRRKEAIFLTRDDYVRFIEVLQETAVLYNLKISAYCLMPNHYHLLLHTPDGNISRCMRHINGVYTQRFNRCHGFDGQLFRGRYKSLLLEADSHLLEVLRYIHRNPIRAKLTTELDYPWSSHDGYISQHKNRQWLYTEALLQMLGKNDAEQKSAYQGFVSGEDSKELLRFYGKKNLPSSFGSTIFKKSIKVRFFHLRKEKEIPAARELAVSIEEIIDMMCQHFAITRKKMMHSRRGQENRARDIAIYLARRHSRATLVVIGSYFGISNYSTVSSAIQRIKTRKDCDSSLKGLIFTLEKKIESIA